jgi:hypothetical protein
MTAIRSSLPPMPLRMTALPIDERGYPVPYFVAWVDGKPDHRIADASKMPGAINSGLCWLCGQKLGAFKYFVIGPMCSITRTSLLKVRDDSQTQGGDDRGANARNA